MKSKTKLQYSDEQAWYMARKRVGSWVSNFFLFFLISGLCFVILQPLLKLVPMVFAHIEDLGNPNVIWLPEAFSVVSFKAASRLILPEGIMTMVKSVFYAGPITLIPDRQSKRLNSSHLQK